MYKALKLTVVGIIFIAGILIWRYQIQQKKIMHDISTSIAVAIETETDVLNFCTAANDRFFNHLLNLIGSIHKHNFSKLGHIVVFDLGLTQEQLQLLSTIARLSVHKLEQTNPEMLVMYDTTLDGKSAAGWYSWKPVAIKQAFEIFPRGSSLLWIDAGTTILRDISDLFEYIRANGYFFHNGWKWPLKRQTTQFVIEALNLHSPGRQWLLEEDVYCIEAGLMGLSFEIYNSIVLPVYELTKDIRYFADDGSAPEGFGYARHDQSLYSIFVRMNKLFVFDHFANQKENIILEFDGQKKPFHIASLASWLTPKTHIYCSRSDLLQWSQNVAYIHHNFLGRLDLSVAYLQMSLKPFSCNLFMKC